MGNGVAVKWQVERQQTSSTQVIMNGGTVTAPNSNRLYSNLNSF
jgi:hypothetical protein